MLKQFVQQGRSERRWRGGTYQASLEPLASIRCEWIGTLPPLIPYVEPLSDARTPLADFFSILLEERLERKDHIIIAVAMVVIDPRRPVLGKRDA
jgi:hypothetical protein